MSRAVKPCQCVPLSRFLTGSRSDSPFLIAPPKELHFGPLLLKQKKTLHFQISNSGQFSFEFFFSLPENKLKARNDQRTEETKTNKGAGPVVTPRKSKTDKLESVRFDESNSLLISPFMITQKFGTVLPHEVVFIPVTCNVEAQSSYSETILCTISNQPPGFEPVSIEIIMQMIDSVTVSCSLVPIVLVQSLTDQDSNSYNWDIGQSIKPDITLLNARDMKPQSSKKEATEVFKSPPQTKKGKSKSQMAKSVASIPSVVSTPINPWGEPKYETLRKEEPKTLTIYVKYVSDVTKYVVPESGLDFYYCPCYQDKTMRLRVLNTGLVPVTLTTSLLLETYGQLSSGPPVSEMVAISSTPVEDFAQPDSPVTEPLHTVVKDRRFLQYKPGKKFEPQDITSLASFCSSNKSESISTLSSSNSGSDDQEPPEPKPVECPFSISPPDIVTIEPGQICVYDVKFRPTLALSYRANLNFYRIPIDSSMEADSQTCTLEGAGSMPWVHLEIPESDLAVTSEVRNSLGASVGGALSWDQRCLGFNVLGEDKAHVIRIKMTNVSPVKYSYTWRPISDQSDSCVPTPSCFEVIEKSEGHLSPGEQSWIEFTFHPYALGIYEARWNLTLSGDRTTAFLLVGVAREPNVRFDNNYLKLSPAFVGMLSSDHICIKNNESCELAFKFIASSLYNEGKQEILQVFPSSGVMKPISHNPVRIEFVPRSSGDFVFNIQCAVTNMATPYSFHYILFYSIHRIEFVPRSSGDFVFNIQCAVTNMLTPLELCVTCRVYPVNVTVTLTTDLGESVELYPNEDNVFDIGKINIHVRTLYQYRIANASIKGVAYSWSLAFNYHKTPLDIEIGNPTGRVAAQSDYGDQFSLLAHRNCVFDNVTLVLYVSNLNLILH
ncbi:uncharacterized protein LOC103512453 [Diaphorina citri]|uniref:Uncharacterized protein LOC103512453 n=1 Tax=Diaphorina citri TaxID=121845 RepID=A0A3Q0IZP4_DIACI|nr:uncharacterized protein LOC103512453 [Diaphorina citri]